ncbi:hypothetical protein AA23498_2714 [Acetobacter nitrogenifigens DSM 23921 = NBRC 105050]|uniref:Uncharacterized protein n=1 Tax=Acetobacter nitrogenifigens DSM 23921 = NBRC 105050 TaxID=1120919 RepID=A0A511XEY8_9PROT|nr:hypothetical protein [Acetobacter nitrogenifigens]GBQ96716.1 hypothetical protein AA23498_2714 [Acetobacter nitrogenifigens DSM 23921 = NBRC 105050]GEN61498.1 hypothetical protein ANI02nite_33820 [Acetobacter nitrogenifigens DSM 23921 = NBRC 105050]
MTPPVHPALEAVLCELVEPFDPRLAEAVRNQPFQRATLIKAFCDSFAVNYPNRAIWLDTLRQNAFRAIVLDKIARGVATDDEIADLVYAEVAQISDHGQHTTWQPEAVFRLTRELRAANASVAA